VVTAIVIRAVFIFNK